MPSALGIIDTAMIGRLIGGMRERRENVVAQEPIGRLGTPEEIAVAVLWLCSDSAVFSTGRRIRQLPITPEALL